MANNVKVYSIDLLLSAFETGKPVFTIQKKKTHKMYKGTYFLDAFYMLNDAIPKAPGWFHIKDVPLTVGVADPADKEDQRNKFDGTRMNVQTSRDKSGNLGVAIDKLEAQWQSQVAEGIKNGSIIIDNQKIKSLLQYKTSKKNTTAPNAVIDDPPLRMAIDFTPFPKTFVPSFLAGKSRTQLFDFDKPYTNEKGVTAYREATVIVGDKEVAVDESNVHLFITNGSVIKTGRIMMTSVSVSDGWISMPINLITATIQRGGDGGFEDDNAGAGVDLSAALTVKTPATAGTSVATLKTSAEKPGADSAAGSAIGAACATGTSSLPDLTEDDIDNVLGDI
jgi:hypothetical protein